MSELRDFETKVFSFIKLSYQQKIVLVTVIVIGLISHLYGMTNLLLNNDTVGSYYKVPDPYSFDTLLGNFGNDRWLLALSEIWISWFKTPLVAGTGIILLFAIFAVIYIELYEIKTIAGTVLCGAIIVSYPTTTSYMSYYSVGYALSAVLSIGGLFLLEKKRRYIAATVCFFLSLAIFPVNIMSILVGYIYLVIKKILTSDKLDWKDFYKPLVIFCGIVLLQCIILLVGMRLRVEITGEMPSYQGADSVASGAFLMNVVQNLKYAFAKTRLLRLSNMQQLPKLKFTLRICYILQIIGMVLVYILRKMYKSISKSLFLSLCLFALPFALSFFTVISPGFDYSSQHRMQWVFVFCGAWIIVESVTENAIKSNELNRIIKFVKSIFVVVCLNSVLMIYGFVLFDNTFYFQSQYVVEKDASLMTRVLAGLDSTEGFDYNVNPVFFFPISPMASPDSTLSPLKLEPELYRTIVGDTDSNMWCYGDRTFKAHIWKYEGIQLKDPDNEIIDEIMENDEYYKQEYDYLGVGDYRIVNYENSGTYVVFVKIHRGYSWTTR